MNRFVLAFEKPIEELENKIKELREFGQAENIDISGDIERLEKKAEKLRREIFSKLGTWERVQLSRHPNRPYTLDYISIICDSFIELHGDRNFHDDPAIVGGLAKVSGKNMVIIGQQKGRTTKEKLYRNFGMPKPEGYRKALRLMSLAERLHLPVLTLIDTPGAYPGIGAEERGQAEAIAKNLLVMARLKTPIVCVVIGEGGSGGALAIGIGDRVLMMEHSIYSVISPESCASILWRDPKHAQQAAKSLKITAPEIKELGVIDEIIPEPEGGAHRAMHMAAYNLRESVMKHMNEICSMPIEDLLKERYKKFRRMGVFEELGEVKPIRG